MTEDMRGSHSWEDCCSGGGWDTGAGTSLLGEWRGLVLKQYVYAILVH